MIYSLLQSINTHLIYNLNIKKEQMVATSKMNNSNRNWHLQWKPIDLKNYFAWV